MEKISVVDKLMDINFDVIITTDVIYNIFKNRLICEKILIINENGDSESLKNLKNVDIIVKFLNSNYTSKNKLFVLGGGCCSDLVSFCASIYKGGINFINVPTTLLACVDSCVGGKNALNLNNVKNTIGTFWPAKEIILVNDVIKSFNSTILRLGIGEIFKYSLLSDSISLSNLHKFELIQIIKKCLKYKQFIVKQDFYDKNTRFCLNLGHSLGHVIESNLKISHGLAVIYGIYLEHLILFKLDIVSKDVFDYIEKSFKSVSLSKLNLKDINFEFYLIQDKKVFKKQIKLPYINQIGSFDFINLDVLTICEHIPDEI